MSLFVDTVIVSISKFKSLFKPIFSNFSLYLPIPSPIESVMVLTKIISNFSVTFVDDIGLIDLGLINLPPHNLIILSNNSVCEL